MELVNDLEKMDEGFVCVDYTQHYRNNSYRRLKVKNPVYVAIAHLKESSASSLRSVLQLVMSGEQDEFLGYFPEFKKYVDKSQFIYRTSHGTNM